MAVRIHTEIVSNNYDTIKHKYCYFLLLYGIYQDPAVNIEQIDSAPSSVTVARRRSKEQTAELMSVFTQRGSNNSTIARWVSADGGGGFRITDGTEMEKLYQYTMALGAWMEYSAIPILTIDEAVHLIST